MAIWNHLRKRRIFTLLFINLLLFGVGIGTASATDDPAARTIVGDGVVTPKVEVNTRILDYGDQAYFVEEGNGGKSRHIWHTDGSESGTAIFMDFGEQTNEIQLIGVYQNLIYLQTLSTDHIHALWVSDGTIDGTVQLLTSETGDFDVWYEFDSWVYISESEEFDHEDYFSLYRTDGTSESVEQVEAPGITDRTDGIEIFPHRVIQTESSIYFWSTPGGSELWMHDEDGFHLSRSFVLPGFQHSRFAANGDTVYFLAQTVDGLNGIWRSDGTEVGTQLILRLAILDDETPVPGFYGQYFLQVADSVLLFGQIESGLNLHRFDMETEELSYVTSFASTQGTTSVRSTSSPVSQLVGDALVFSIVVGDRTQFWRTEGTADSTHALGSRLSVRPYALSVQAHGFVFLAGDSNLFWMDLDGDPALMIHNLGHYPFISPSLTTVQGYVYYTAYDSVGNHHLWQLNPETISVNSIRFPLISVAP